jgi:lysophospholipase L1-like esterase
MSRLRTAYQGPCIQVQRTSDDVLKAIAFSGEDMDALALTAHGASTLRTWYDQGTTGTNVVQATESKQPALTKDAVVQQYFAVGDGTNTGMETASTVDMTGATAATVILCARHKTGGLGLLIEQLSTAGWTIYSQIATDTIGAQFNSSGGDFIQAKTAQLRAQESTYVIALVYEPGAATNDEKVAISLNGTGIDETQTAVSGTITTAGFIDAKISMFARTLTDFPTTSGIHTAMVFKGKLTSGEFAKVNSWLQAKAGGYADVPSKWDDSRNTFTQSGPLVSCSPYATASYTTKATRVGIHTQHGYPVDDQKRVGVYIDNAYYADALCTPSADFGRVEVVLPAGIKKVTVVGGIANWPGAGNIFGIYPQCVEFNSPITRVAEVNTNRLTILGDSITVGASATVLQSQGWPVQLRLYNSIPVSIDGYGYRSLYEESVDASARTASVARLLEHNPRNIWIALGTNDWGRGDWDAGDFQTAYAALLVAINASLPTATIYCQTPVLTGSEATTNTFGETMQDYRDAVIAATTGKAYATPVNWLSVLLAGDLADSVHPNTSGHTKMFNAAKTVLGI